MLNEFSRTELVLGTEAVERLRRSRVAVFGIGGVGGYAVEALARCGVGTLELIDNDTVSLTNINRQIIALHSTVGRPKVDAAAERIRDICPETAVIRRQCFYLPENADDFDFSQYDYVIDAIDTVKGKLGIIMQAQAAGVPVISCMGTGNKLDPSALRVADIYETKVCPLARVMRSELRKRGVQALKVVYSEELPRTPAPDAAAALAETEQQSAAKRSIPGSVSFVPPAAGLLLAREAVLHLIQLP